MGRGKEMRWGKRGEWETGVLEERAGRDKVRRESGVKGARGVWRNKRKEIGKKKWKKEKERDKKGASVRDNKTSFIVLM